MSQVVEENPQTVAKKGQFAVKTLADRIGKLYEQKLAKEGNLENENQKTLKQKHDEAMKVLSQSIGQKY